MLRSVRVGRDEGQVDRRAHRRRKLFLGFLSRLDQPLGRHLILREIYAFGLLELRDDPLDDLGVEVVTTETVVAARGLDLEDAIAEREDGDVEGATAEVEDENGLLLFLVKTIGERGRRRLVDDPLYVKTGDPTSVLGRLALGVLEVGRYRDDRLGNLLAEVLLGVPLELLQDHRGDLRWRILLI